MKFTTTIFFLAAIAAIMLTCISPAFAQVNSIAVDESGHMTINGAPGPAAIVGVEPISGQNTLIYTLPFQGIQGDVLLYEGSVTNSPLSDIVRFDANFSMYIFSDTPPSDPADSQADGPLPTFILPNNVSLSEVGPEGNNGAIWQPGATGIGGDPNNPNVIYHIVSDGFVPEPSSLLLVGLGGSGLLLAVRRRRRSPTV
jgi:PEP-CTERM motif